MNYADKPFYTAKDFKKGQEVYLRVITGSNIAGQFGLQSLARWSRESPPALDEDYISARIVKGTVVTVGRKYLTVEAERGYYREVKFDMTENFRQSVNAGSLDYNVFPDRKGAEEDIRFEYYYQYVQSKFGSPSRYTYRQIRLMYEVMTGQAVLADTLIQISMALQQIIDQRSDIREVWELSEEMQDTLPDWADEFIEAGYGPSRIRCFTAMKAFAYRDMVVKNPHDTAWYFSFGSDPSYPLQDTFVIVYAGSEDEAVKFFRSHYPEAHEAMPDGVANCCWIYPEEKWKGTASAEAFGEMPAAVIFSGKGEM